MVSASATAAAPLSRQFADRVQSYVFIMSRQNISPPFRLSLLFRKWRTGYIYNKVRFRVVIQIFSTRRKGGLCRCACWRGSVFQCFLLKDRPIKRCFLLKERPIKRWFLLKDRPIKRCFLLKERPIGRCFLLKDRPIKCCLLLKERPVGHCFLQISRKLQAVIKHCIQPAGDCLVLNLSYKINLNTDCFLFMKHNSYLCSK